MGVDMDMEGSDSEDIAIIGIAGRFPGAEDVQHFWENLLDGKVESTRFSVSELLEAGVNPDHLQNENFVRSAPVLENAERFDADFFNYSPYEAQLIDPQQRQLLEVAWLAMENAGYDPARIDGRVATFAGTAMNTYLLHTGLAQHFFQDYLPTLLGSDKDYIATRIAYKLGLKGPAVTVQTACSTSLVAVHMARQSLLEHESDLALVGAASVRCPLKTGHLYQEGSVFSPDGYCRPFDASAGGTVFGSGAGAVLLKRLDDAEADGDHIYAVIRGTAVNNDGNTKSDFTAPTVIKQAEVIVEAMEAANVSADTIGYVESHGTGTYLGDPIEIEALSKAYRLDTDKTGYCKIGSVKGNIGHLDAAAGMASLIKVTKSLEKKKIPASGSYQSPNPQIDFPDTPFQVASKASEWTQPSDHLRRAGISSLGMGGTNSHVIMEEYKGAKKQLSNSECKPQILPLSAATPTALKLMIARLAEYLGRELSHIELSDVVFTLQQGRKELPYRAALVGETLADVVSSLERARLPDLVTGQATNDKHRYPITLMFPGQGSQYAGMGAALYENEQIFRKYIDIAEEIVSKEFGFSIVDVLCNPAREDINQTYLTQPALYVSSYAYAKLLESWGVKAERYIGHSIGEFVAAACSEVFTYEDGLRLVANRGRLMQEAPGGSMLMVASPSDYVRNNLAPDVELAVINNTSTCVVAGTDEAVVTAKEYYEEKNISCRVLKTSHAFHTRMMNAAASEFENIVKTINLSKPVVPFISCVTGNWITEEDAVSANYWCRQIRSPVNFSDALANSFSSGSGWFLEAGPGVVLSQVASAHEDREDHHVVLSAGRHPNGEDSEYIVAYRLLANMWAVGGTIDWSVVGPADGSRVPLPGYPFEGKSHWFSDSSSVINGNSEPMLLPVDPEDWIWRESWGFVRDEQNDEIAKQGRYLILDAGNNVGDLAGALQGFGVSAETFTEEGTLLKALSDYRSSEEAIGILYVPEHTSFLTSDDLSNLFQADFEFVKRAVESVDSPLHLTVVQFGTLPVFGDTCEESRGSLMVGMLPVFEAEYPTLTTQYIDISASDGDIKSLAQKLVHRTDHQVICLKDDRWWSRIYERQPFVQTNKQVLKENSCHVVVGAFGGIGKYVTDLLATKAGKLILVGRVNPERIAYVESIRRDDLQVVLLEIDVTDENDCELISAEISNSGKFNQGYIFHLAGSTADGLIASKKIAESGKVLSSKLHGTRNLFKVVSTTDMKLVLFSSIAAISGPVGQVDYAAANSFQLYFGHAEDNVISIAWPGWKNTGLLSKVKDVSALQKIERTALSPDLALSVLEQILNNCNNCGPIVVSGTSPNESYLSPRSERTGSAEQGGESEEELVEPIDIVIAELKKALKIDTIESDDNIMSLGGSSLMVVSVLSSLRSRYGVTISLSDALAGPVVSEWVRLFSEGRASKQQQTGASELVYDDSAEGDLPNVTGISRFLDRRAGADFNQWNLAVMLECNRQFDKPAMEKCVLMLANHHEMLRGKLDIGEAGDYQITVRNALESISIETVDMSSIEDEDLARAIEDTADECHKQFSLSESILFRCVHFSCGSHRPDRLLFLVHHFVADGLSWTIILTDMQKAYEQLLEGNSPSLPEKTTSYRKWSLQLQRRASTDEFIDSAMAWQELPWSRLGAIPLELGTSVNNLNTSGAHVQRVIDQSISLKLLGATSLGSINEVLILALSRAIALWADWEETELALIDVLGHGRSLQDDCDVTRTVGFFNSYTPVLVNPAINCNDQMSVLSGSCEEIKGMLAKLNEHDLAKYVCVDADVKSMMSKVPSSEVLFNYIGNLKNSNDDLLNPDLFKVAQESHGTLHSSSSKRDHILALRVEHVDESLMLTLVYSTGIHRQESMNALLDLYANQLKIISEFEGI